jgi:GxxExxY protein
MKVGLHDMALKFETERDLPVTFRGRYVGTVRADLVVENNLVIELKITGKIEDAEDQCRQYMKLTGIQRGLVILFPKRDENLIVFRCVKA